MKLRKILAGFLAGAVAMSSMVVTSVTASAAVTLVDGKVADMSDSTDIAAAGLGAVAWDGTGAHVTAAELAACNLTAGSTFLTINFSTAAGGQFYCADMSDWSQNAAWYNNGGSITVTLTEAMLANGIMFNGADITIDSVAYVSVLDEYVAGTTWNVGTAVSWDGTGAGVTAENFAAEDVVAGTTYIKVDFTTAAGGQFYCADTSDWSQNATWYNASGSALFAVTEAMVANGIMFNGADVTIDTITAYNPSDFTPAPVLYTVTIDSAIENGTVTADVTEAEEGATVTLTVTPDDGYELVSIERTYEDDSIIPPTMTGNTFPMSASNVTISATFAEIVAEAVTLDRTTASILVGGTTTLVAAVEPENALDTTVTWSSSDAAVATVDQTGKVTGIAAGTATITAVCGDVSASCEVTVTEEEVPVESITLDASEITSYVGVTTTVTATVLPADATYDSITWTSSDTSIATVANGKITAVAEGTATITAAIGDITASVKITVIPEGYDKTEASFTADTIVAQTSKSINELGDVVTARRFVKMVSKASIEDKNLVTFTLSNGGITVTEEATNYYTALSASGATVTAPEGYVFLAYTVTDIPEGVTVTCTDITVSKK